MKTLKTALALCVAAATLAAPALSQAGERVRVTCSVAVDYSVNNVGVESYRKDFIAEAGVGFTDDFSTATRQKTFAASVARVGGDTVVSIDYFSDVGVFSSVAFNAQLKLKGGGAADSTTGNYTFFLTQGTTSRNATDYTLTCRRV